MRKLTVMTIRKMHSGEFADRARKSAREIGLAVFLTLAGVTFLIAALQRNSPETASISPPQGIIENQAN